MIRSLLIIFSIALMIGCQSKPKVLYIPAGEADYCAREPEAPICAPFLNP